MIRLYMTDDKDAVVDRDWLENAQSAIGADLGIVTNALDQNWTFWLELVTSLFSMMDLAEGDALDQIEDVIQIISSFRASIFTCIMKCSLF